MAASRAHRWSGGELDKLLLQVSERVRGLNAAQASVEILHTRVDVLVEREQLTN
jgi:hypothetical protein